MMEVLPPQKTTPFVAIVVAICVVLITLFVGTLVASPIEATMPTINSSTNLNGTPWDTTAVPSFIPVVVIIIAIGIVIFYIRTYGE